MKTMKVTIPVLLAVAACVGGCKKEQKAVAPSNYWELPSDAVVLRVNGHDLTKGEQERNLDLQEALSMIANPKTDARQRKAMRAKMLRACESLFIQKTLVEEWGRTNNIVLSDAERELGRIEFAYRLTKGRMGYDKIAGRLRKDLAGELDRYVDGQQYGKKCVEEMAKRNVKPVKSEELGKRRRYFQQYNKEVAATNAVIWAAASNLWARVQKNPAAFNDEIVKYQQQEVEHVFSDPDIGEVGLSIFEDDPTWKEDLLKAKPGDILRPRAGDNGLLMVKVLECIPPNEDQEPKEPKWRLSKIFWELGEEWEPQSNAELLADIEKIHLREAREQGYRALLSGVQISYPSGTNLLHRTKGSRTQQQKLPPGVMVPARVRKAIEKGE